MPIPTTDQMTLPVLQHIADGQEYRRLRIINMLTAHFSLTEDERKCLGKSGQMEKSLCRKGFIERSREGHYRITSLGLEVLNPDSDTNTGIGGNPSVSDPVESFETAENNRHPEESIEVNYQQIKKELAEELLQQIKKNSPTFFEKLVIDLLVKMGYGGSQEDAGKAVGAVVMVGLMVLLKRIHSVLMLFTFKQNDGKKTWEHHRFETLWEH